MITRPILAATAALALMPATVAVSAPAHAQSGVYDTYVGRDGYTYQRERRGASYRHYYGGRGRSSGVGVGSEACDDPSYKMDPRCYSNR